MKRLITFLISFCLVFEQTGFAQVALPLGIPGYASGLSAPEKLRPSHLRYLSYDPLNNKFRVLLDKGDKKNLKEEELRISAQDLFRFFLIGLTLPNDSFWVNLRPDSPQDIIDPDLAGTDIGRILLEADVQLKKDTARYTAPDTTEGKVYWARLHQKTSELFASRQIDLPTLTRPWIVPNEIILRASGGSVYIYKASLKVMLESDYLKRSAGYSFSDERLKILNEYSSSLIRELIIPKLSKDINTLPKYAGLRQVYYSLILAQWFKKQFKDDPGMAKVIDRKDLAGLASAKAWSKDTYFRRYQESFQKGEYNRQGYAQTPYGQTILQYFSGGIKINTERAAPPETYRKGFDPSLLPNTAMFEGAVSDGLEPKLTPLIKGPGNAGAGEKNAERKRPDGGMISFSRDELKGYIADELDEPSVAGLKKSYENLYPDIPVYWEKNARIPVASIIPSKQSRIVLKELAARIMEFRQENKKNVVLWKDADVNGKIRNFIVDGHHRFAAAEIINRSTGVTGDKINFLSADVFDPLRKGRTSFSSIEPRPISEIKVLLPDGREVQLKELTLKEISNKDRIIFELDTDGGKSSQGAGSFVFDYQKSVESFLRSFMELRDPAANNGKARVFSYILPPGSPKQRKDAFRSRLDDFIDYLPVDINRQIVRPGLGVDFIIQELCKNAFDRLVSPESLSRSGSADTLEINVYFALRAGVNQEKSLEISVEDTGAGKHAANAGDKRGYSMYLEDERSPYLSWTDDWGKFNQQVIDKVNGKIKGSLAAGYKETLADIPGEKSSAVFEIPLESLVLTGLKPPQGPGESDGGEIILKVYGKEYALPEETVKDIHLWSGSRYDRMDAVSKEAALSRDAEALWELYSLIWKNDLKTAGNIRADKIAEYKKLLTAGSAELLWVFEPVPGQIKGYMTVTEKETYVTITSGAVAEEYQRKKIGTALCLTMMGFMERKGVKRFETNTVGAGSQKIADSLGWEHDEDGGPFQYFFEPVLPAAAGLAADPAAEAELARIYKRITGGKDTVGSGLMFNVYELPEYPHLVFKVLREKGEVFELALEEEIWRMGEIVRELGADKVSVDGFVLSSVRRLAPFAYCRITDPAGRPALIVVQQKADTRIDDGEFDAFVRDWDQRLFWWDREKNNVGRINGETVLIDFGGLEMAEYALQRIEAGSSDAMSLLVEEILKRDKVPPDEFERMLKDGGIATFEGRLAAQVDGILAGRPDIAAGTIKKLFGRELPRGAHYKVEYLAAGAYKKVYKVSVFLDHPEYLEFVLKTMDSVGKSELMRGYDEIDPEGKNFLITPMNSSYAARQGIQTSVNDIEVFTEELLDPILLEKLDQQEIAAAVAGLVKAYFLSAGLSQWPDGQKDTLFPVDIAFKNAGFTRSAKPTVKVLDMDLARRYTPLKILEACSSALAGIKTPGAASSVLKGIREAMDGPSASAFFRRAAGELKELFDKGAVEFRKENVGIQRKNSGYYAFTGYTHLDYDIYDELAKFAQLPSYDGKIPDKKDGGEDERGISIPYDDEIDQAKGFLADKGYPEAQIAGWLARGRAKLLEIAEVEGFRPIPGDRRDNAKVMTGPVDRRLSVNDYRNNIQQAVQRQEILIYTGQDDAFSALAGGLTGGNTRGLPEDTKDFFKKYFQANAWDQDGVDILVLGVGAGKECSDIYGLARGISLPINIDTVSLSPIDPSLLLKASSLEIRRMLYEYIQRSAMKSAELGPEELSRIRSLPQARSGIPWETVFELHNNGYPVCDPLDKPFIRRQYIVELNALDIEKKYGLIYDQIGGFWYSVKKDGIEKTIQTISRLLRPEGLFYAENFPEPMDFSSAAIPEGFIGITSDVNDRLLLAGKGGRIAKLVSGILAASAREGNVYKTADFGRIFSTLGTAKPGPANGVVYADGGLRAYIANKDPGREVVDVDLWAGEYIDPILAAVRSDKAVALHLSNGAFTLGERGGKLANKLKFICIMLAREFTPFPDADIQKSILEVMKNAFIHGNKTDMSVPIYLYLKLDDIGWMDALTVYNNTLDVQLTEIEKQLLLNSGWSGRNKGVNNLQKKFRYERLALPDLQACKVTITPGDGDKAEALADKDGGNKGGIDLRSLPVSEGRGFALTAGANPALADMDMTGEWRQIRNMINSGFIPNIQRIRDYTAACCQKGLIQSEKEGILLCVADILRSEEDKNLDTDPGIKDLLANIEQLS